MTLNTRIAIGAPTDVRELLTFCQRLVNTPPGHGIHESDGYGQPGVRLIGNPIGIGADALLAIHYAPDGTLPTHVHDKWCATELGGEWEHTQEDVDHHAEHIASDPTENGWAAIEVSFDTAYSYRGDGGESCSDLHARILTALGQWLDARNLPWKWQNEYTSEWHDGYDGLAEFGDAHRSTGADTWFRTVALPAIAAEVQR